MEDNTTMSRAEIIRAIEDGDRHAGVLAEETNDKFKIIMESYDTLDKKIDDVDRKLMDFREEANMKFGILFEGQKSLFEDNQRFFEELRAMYKEFSKRFDRLEKMI